jgi:zinc/manganese transport system substrate-binding protein
MRHLLALSTSILILALAGQARAAVDVAATVPDLAAITKEIGGSNVNVTSLSLATQDPHFVDAKPSLVLKLHKADLLVAVGLDLEIGWLPTLQTQARNGKIQVGSTGYLECSEFVRVLDINGRADRAEGDVHPAGNPHYLYDPRAAGACAKGIAARLAKIDPSHAKNYDKGLKSFLVRLDKARKGWEERLAAYRDKPIISYHKSMSYLADWLGLREIGTLEPKPGIPPTATHVVDIIKAARGNGARVVLEESYYPDKTGTLVANKIHGKVVVVPGGTDVQSGESYIAHMGKVVDKLEAALR